MVSYLDHGFDRVLGFENAGGVDPARQIVIRARNRADAAFDTFVNERGGGSLDQEMAAFLLSSANHAIVVGEILEVISGVMGYQAGSCAQGASEVREEVRKLLGAYSGLAERLSLSPATEAQSRVSTAALREAELGCLRRWQTDADVGRGAMAVVMAAEWVQNLARLEVDLDGAASTAVEAARKPWWR